MLHEEWGIEKVKRIYKDKNGTPIKLGDMIKAASFLMRVVEVDGMFRLMTKGFKVLSSLDVVNASTLEIVKDE